MSRGETIPASRSDVDGKMQEIVMTSSPDPRKLCTDQMTHAIQISNLRTIRPPSFPSSLHHSASISRPPRPKRDPPRKAVKDDDRQHEAHPLARRALRVVVDFQHRFAVDLALRGEVGRVHAVAGRGAWRRRGARVGAVRELVDHHALEDVCL